MKDFEILKELEFLELKLLLVPKIIRVKRIEEKNRFLILPMIDFRKKNFEIKGFDQIFKKPKLFCLARLITLLVSAQYFSKGHAAVGIISLAIGKYQKQISIEYIELLTMAIASDLDSLNAE